MYWTLILVLVAVAAKAQVNLQEDAPQEADVLQTAPENLIYAYVIFRHGLRTALYDPFPSDPNQDPAVTWPEGKGSLTEVGRQQMRRVGQSLWTRYKRLVPEDILTDDVVKVTATESPRAVESATILARSMFPNRGHLYASDDPYDHNEIFDDTEQNATCLTYASLHAEVLRAEKEREPSRRRRFYSFLTDKVNTPERNTTSQLTVDTLEEVFHIYDTITMEKLNAKPTVTWANQCMPAIKTLAQLRMWSYMHAKTGMLQFFTGTMLHRILGECEEALGKGMEMDQNRLRLHLHGSHDSSMSALYWAITLRESYYAMPGDTLMVELYRNSTVKLFHYSPLKETQSERFKQISLKHLCHQDHCTLLALRNKVLTLHQEQWSDMCHKPLNQLSQWREPPTLF